MIQDLRARLKAVQDAPKPTAPPHTCMEIATRTPLDKMDGLADVCGRQTLRLGLELPDLDVRRALFLDTETTGLRGAGTVAFLVGLGWVEGEEFVVYQLLMRDYPQEVDLLEKLADLLPRFDCIVSFNGKSFDLPLLRDRFTMSRLRDRWTELPGLDLLHVARRTWKMRLGSCTLGNLETEVLGTPREGDLPGADIPERYYQFLKSGDLTLLDDVLRHNAQDIRTMGVLLARLARAYEEPEREESMMDVLSIGRALERRGEREAARRCFRVAGVSQLSEVARLELAGSYRRECDYTQAAEVYRGMVTRGEGGIEAYVSLAILLEWRLHDIQGALEITEKALWRFAGGDFLRHADKETIAALECRRARLKKRIAKQA